MVGELFSLITYLLNVKSNYLDIADLLHNALVVLVVGLLSEKMYVPNLKLIFFNIAELLHNALVAMGATKTFAKCEVKIL